MVLLLSVVAIALAMPMIEATKFYEQSHVDDTDPNSSPDQAKQSLELSRLESAMTHPDSDPTICNITTAFRSTNYFGNVLETVKPNFIHFTIYINSLNIDWNATRQTFKKDKWVWTYKSSRGLYPYLFWNIDFNILSFGLLDAKTLHSDRMYVLLHAPKACDIKFGTRATTYAIGRALKYMIEDIVKRNDVLAEYEESFFCYLAENTISHDSLSYRAAVYFLYPISYINYNCCNTFHDYNNNNFTVNCEDKQIEKWSQCILGPYLLGIIIILYFPIWMFQLAAWMSSDEAVISSEYEMIAPADDTKDEHPRQGDDDWIYLDGETPYKFTDLLTYIWCGLNKGWPTAASRCRRLLLLLAMPIGIYLQILIYYCKMENDTKLLVKHGTPMGFLSLLGDREYRRKSFATVLGGPEVLIILYYSIGFLFLVIPYSLKQITENGMPTQSFRFKSPLFLSVKEVRKLAMANYSLKPGYAKGVTMFKCGVYVLFSKQFWRFVFSTQVERVYSRTQEPSSKKLMLALKLAALPLYVVFCLLEILLCIVLYGFPFCMFTLIMLRGATRSLEGFRKDLMQYCHNSVLRKIFIDNTAIKVFSYVCTAILIILFSYVICLVFLQTFYFISQVIVFCFVAVIIYPSISFGYLFFFVVLIYYIVSRIRDFGDGYLELLSDAVEISRNLEGHPNQVTFCGDVMMITNVKTPFGVKSIQINNTTLSVAQNVFQSVTNDQETLPKLKMVDSVYGIPRDLFAFLVKHHRPAHQQLLKIAFNIFLILVLIWMTISITSKYVSGPSSDISEVMHVIFIMAVGALPRVLEVAMTNASASIKKEIELRRLEQSVVEFWADMGRHAE